MGAQVDADAIAALHAAGAHLVEYTVWQEPDGKWEKKAGPTGWNVLPRTLEQITRHHHAGGKVGILPPSLGLACIDVDSNPDAFTLAQLTTAFDNKLGANAVAAYPSATKGRAHLWYRARTVKTRAWAWQGMAGEVRSGGGLGVVIHRLEPLAQGAALVGLAAQATTSALLTPLKSRGQKARGRKLAAIGLTADTPQGERNTALNASAYALGKAGATDAEFAALRVQAIGLGLPAGEVDKTIASGRAAGEAKRAGVLAYSDHRGLADCLERERYRYRLNTRLQDIELCNATGGWYAPEDADNASLRARIRETYEVLDKDGEAQTYDLSAARWDEYMLALVQPTRTDPFLDWIEGLPTWDGVERLDGLLPALWTECSVDDALTRWAGAAPLVGAIRRAREPGAALKTMVVLEGPQRAGKSPFFSHLFPTAHRFDWFSDGLKLNDKPQAMAEALLGRVIVEVGELSGATRGERESLKAFLSRRDDGSVRLAYAKRPVKLLRRCAIVGTANNDGSGILPNDPTGQSRFLPIHVGHSHKGPIEPYVDSVREMLWAEARARVDGGDDGQLPYDLWSTADGQARSMAIRPAWQHVVDDIDHAEINPKGLTLGRMMERWPAIRTHPRLLSGYLLQGGWSRGEGRQRRMYQPPAGELS